MRKFRRFPDSFSSNFRELKSILLHDKKQTAEKLVSLQIGKGSVFWRMKLDFRSVRLSERVVCIPGSSVFQVRLYIGRLEYIIPRILKLVFKVICEVDVRAASMGHLL
jgi:hypothetical protein